MSKHTPGPWEVRHESIDPRWAIVTTSMGDIVANVNAETGPDIPPLVTTKMPRAANAALIAAAPALLAALEVISMCEDNHYHDDPESDYDQGRRSMARYVAGIADAAIEKIKKANGEDANEATIPKARFEKMIAERNARIKEIQR